VATTDLSVALGDDGASCARLAARGRSPCGRPG
jgi:hypothetical protein